MIKWQFQHEYIRLKYYTNKFNLFVVCKLFKKRKFNTFQCMDHFSRSISGQLGLINEASFMV